MGQGAARAYTFMMRSEPGLDFILPLIAVLTKEPEMLQTMRFASIQCSKMQLQSGLCSEPRWISWLYSAFPDPLADFKGVKGKGRALDIAPQVDMATAEVLRYMARTKQRRTYTCLIYLPSYSRYSFTDPERMEG